MSDTALVSLRRWDTFPALPDVLRTCLQDVGGIERFISPGQTVLIKPNIVGNNPADSGSTAHPEVVEELIAHVRCCRPGRIIVAEGTPPFGTTQETAFRTGGWREMAARADVELYNLDAGPHVEGRLERPRYPHALPFAKPILDADVYISVACLKMHIHTDYTVALKNAFGLTPQWKRSEIHGQYLLEEALVDLNRIRRPDLIVVDGYEGVEGIGGGIGVKHPARARLMLAGDDPVAVDTVARQVMGCDVRTRYLQWAEEEGLGVSDPARIRVVGEAVADCRRVFMPPSGEVCELMPGLTTHERGACSGCRGRTMTALYRFVHQKLRAPLDVVYGGKGEAPAVKGWTLAVGNCAAPYAPLGAHVGGCPATVPDLVAALKGSGCICEDCAHIVREALEATPELASPLLRVTAAGEQGFVGQDVARDRWHQELVVGDCSAHYAQTLRERARQFGLDAEKDIVWLRGCPVTREDVRAALVSLRQALAAREMAAR